MGLWRQEEPHHFSPLQGLFNRAPGLVRISGDEVRSESQKKVLRQESDTLVPGIQGAQLLDCARAKVLYSRRTHRCHLIFPKG